jgi:hypothetical protein
MRSSIDQRLAVARTKLDTAQARCQVAARGPAARSLRGMRRRLRRVGKLLDALQTHRSIPPAVTTPIRGDALSLAADARSLALGLVCP